MAEKIKNNSGMKNNENPHAHADGVGTINDMVKLSDQIQGKLPDDFDFQDIGKINLKEAEEIANEDIYFITEKDLLSGLEDFNLIPLKDDEGSARKPKQVFPGMRNRILEQEQDEEIQLAGSIVIAKESKASVEEMSLEVAIEEEPIGITDATISPEEKEIIEAERKSNDDIDIEKKENAEDFATATENFDNTYEDENSIKWVPVDHILEQKEQPESIEAKHVEQTIVFVDEFANSEIDNYESVTVIKRSKLYRGHADGMVFIDELTDKKNDFKIYDYERFSLNKATASPYNENAIRAREPVEIPSTDEYDELAYLDDELEFVNFSIVQDDYGSYINKIDDFNKVQDQPQLSSTIELLGLTFDEIRLVEDMLFHDDYKDVNFKEVFDYFKPKEIQPFSLDKNFRYILHYTESLSDSVKISIQEDVTSASALIYEENVDDIKRQLTESLNDGNYRDNTYLENIYDITDRVVILEDDLDVDRFVRGFPEEKQTDMKKLLNYFDGLFEKLPESTIKKFADSEYYELYVKVLHDLGV